MLKYWDRRTGAALPQLGVENDASRACISHIASSPPTLRARGDDGAVVAVNSYDDSVRVYKRYALAPRPRARRPCAHVRPRAGSEPAELEADGAPPAGPALRLLHELRGTPAPRGSARHRSAARLTRGRRSRASQQELAHQVRHVPRA